MRCRRARYTVAARGGSRSEASRSSSEGPVLTRTALLLSALVHAGLLLALGGTSVGAAGREELLAQAQVRNQAATEEELGEPLETFAPPPLLPEPPVEPPPPEPFLVEEPDPLLEPLAPKPGDASFELAPIELPPPRAPRRALRRRPPPPPPAQDPAPPPPQAGSAEDRVRDVEFAPAPAYPRRALSLGLDGTVVLLALVRADGNVEACEVESSSGHELLDEAARAALLQWRFRPRVVDGIPRPFTARVPFRFVDPRRAG